VKINDKTISGATSYYPYKVYISNVLSYSTIVKASQLQSQGYYPDISGHFDGTEDNTGFMTRNACFREGYGKTKPYRKEGAFFIGKLHHDLITCETGIPPGTKIRFELDRSSDDFVLIKKATDTTDYKIKILNIALLMPIAQLSQSVFNEYESLLTRSVNTKPVGISFRRIDIKPYNIPRNSVSYHSELLFSDDMPTRIVVCFIESDRHLGNPNKSPFFFKRKWLVKVPEPPTPPSIQNNRESELERRLRDIESQGRHREQELLKRLEEAEELNRQLLTSLRSKTRGKGPGRGKKSQQVSEPTPSTSSAPSLQSQTDRFIQFTANDRQQDERSESPMTADESFNEGLTAPTFKEIYLKKVELILNGAPLDQLEGNYSQQLKES